MSIETTSSSSLSFSIAAGTESTKIGQINSTKWFMVFNWKPTSAYGYDLKSVKLVRLGKSDEIFIVLIDIENLCKNFLVCFNNEQAHANIFNNNFVAAFDNTDELKGTITIVNLEVCRSTNQNNESPLNAAVSKPIDPLPKLSEDLHSLLTDPSMFADVTLKCTGSDFPAHKCILSTRSPVFAAMFRNEDMQENQKGIIDIVDIKEDVVQAMLKYIYGAKIDDLTHFMSGDLLFAADKYEIEGLKQICVDILKNTLEMESVLQVLVLGYLHDEGLKKYTIQFICEQNLFRKLKETEEWDLVQKNHPSLAMEILTSVVNYLDDLKSPSTDDIPCWDHLIKEPTTTPEGDADWLPLADPGWGIGVRYHPAPGEARAPSTNIFN
ncbi:hypothetical protein JTE90_000753 [Oedothorax gibbosus]|uniref:BTB domain-containing protein n=1 Tax=Oedothorax gibbosus TaxID=931172 RepID=A0AAV6UNH3_9ARAC|nr:hypothetical protein JTE90_000753 [Oedothorax gibbosus]